MSDLQYHKVTPYRQSHSSGATLSFYYDWSCIGAINTPHEDAGLATVMIAEKIRTDKMTQVRTVMQKVLKEVKNERQGQARTRETSDAGVHSAHNAMRHGP